MIFESASSWLRGKSACRAAVSVLVINACTPNANPNQGEVLETLSDHDQQTETASKAIPAVNEGCFPARVSSIVTDAHLRTDFEFQLGFRRNTFLRVLEVPVIAADLWRMFEYAPAYRVTEEEGGVIRISDPSGIRGRVESVAHGCGTYTWLYLADGHLDHWAAPALNKGKAVFVLQLSEEGKSMRAKLSVYLQAESVVAGAVTEVVGPLVQEHVENRIRLNINDFNYMLDLIENRPAEVGQLYKIFLEDDPQGRLALYEAAFSTSLYSEKK